MRNRMSSVRTDDKVCMHVHFAKRRFCTDTDHPIVLYQQIDDLGFHVQLETWKTLRMAGQKIQEIPLRHKGDELATCGEFGEVSDRHDLPVNHGAQFSHFLMRLFQEFIEQPKLVHQFQGGGMDGVAAEITKE